MASSVARVGVASRSWSAYSAGCARTQLISSSTAGARPSPRWLSPRVGSVSPVASLAVASAASAPQAASDVASVTSRLVAEVTATLTEDLPGSLPTAPPSAALTTMVGQAATQQQSLAPLLADLAVAVTSPAMPADARATAVQILAAQTPLDADVTAQQ